MNENKENNDGSRGRLSQKKRSAKKRDRVLRKKQNRKVYTGKNYSISQVKTISIWYIARIIAIKGGLEEPEKDKNMVLASEIKIKLDHLH